jgi:hypothetical protein
MISPVAGETLTRGLQPFTATYGGRRVGLRDRDRL